MFERFKKKYRAILKISRLQKFERGGHIPWTVGYDDYRWLQINKALNDNQVLTQLRNGVLGQGYGRGIDERIIEYPWVFSKLKKEAGKLLDAGSTFNFETILEQEVLQSKELSIYTYFPEPWNFVNKRISYQFGDLREIPYRDDWFDQIVCISTLEHIGMDNTIYGYSDSTDQTEKLNNEYLKCAKELLRILKPGGQLFMTFPFGKNIDYGYFQQFNSMMVNDLLKVFSSNGVTSSSFFQYTPDGWVFSDEGSCKECEAYNPHTGQGKGTDGAAHSRGICAIHFIKRDA